MLNFQFLAFCIDIEIQEFVNSPRTTSLSCFADSVRSVILWRTILRAPISSAVSLKTKMTIPSNPLRNFPLSALFQPPNHSSFSSFSVFPSNYWNSIIPFNQFVTFCALVAPNFPNVFFFFHFSIYVSDCNFHCAFNCLA